MAASAINLQHTCRLTQVSIGQHQSTEEVSRPWPSLVPGSAAALCPATTDTSGCLPRFHCPDACGASPTQRMLREGPMVEDYLTASATGLPRDLRNRVPAKTSYACPTQHELPKSLDGIKFALLCGARVGFLRPKEPFRVILMLLAKREYATFLQQRSRATLHASVQILSHIRELPFLVC